MIIDYTEIGSPVGRLRLVGHDEMLCGIGFHADRTRPEFKWRARATAFPEAVSQIRAYFAGELREFDLAISPKGTAFQVAVWEELRRIRFGETISYGDLTRRIGRPSAVRAVGAANGRNPIPIVIPCHRVIGANGELTGFTGGLDVKRKLLGIESPPLL